MIHQFHAIYEHGILRPIEPLNLPESTEVAGMLHETIAAPPVPPAVAPEEIRRQQEALGAMFREVDRLVQTPRKDGFNGRDHDKILYGNHR